MVPKGVIPFALFRGTKFASGGRIRPFFYFRYAIIGIQVIKTERMIRKNDGKK